jgi:hypothetical protein
MASDGNGHPSGRRPRKKARFAAAPVPMATKNEEEPRMAGPRNSVVMLPDRLMP